MSKKMKRVAFDSSPHVSYDDIKTRFKHQTLFQDYLDLQQKTEAARNRLEVMKQKKHTLEAEVRFLRRRYKFLMKTKSSAPQQVKSHIVETTQYRKSKKEKVNPKKVATLLSLPQIPDEFQRGKPFTKKKNTIPSQPLPVFDLDRNVNLHVNNSSPVTEINQKSDVGQAKAPIFDLNQISIEAAELQESFEDLRKEQQNDLKLSICRNVGDGSTNRSGKRKISWQDPVALRV
ncbi:hypothetical protein M8C21_001044 [Ambrosia artemisiifolia]|uniref:Uncharacterized protein n=1 Tax=Ambrosia artemisiifolia TaxID=4212 RepID=A0AAD5BU86_AMBAR|nr:hypothetical protein M8C21_001044 [Ambrosia artemisiifolia]